jgi:hypothetical protein
MCEARREALFVGGYKMANIRIPDSITFSFQYEEQINVGL